jgi:hypothetical protein
MGLPRRLERKLSGAAGLVQTDLGLSLSGCKKDKKTAFNKQAKKAQYPSDCYFQMVWFE